MNRRGFIKLALTATALTLSGWFPRVQPKPELECEQPWSNIPRGDNGFQREYLEAALERFKSMRDQRGEPLFFRNFESSL